MGRRLRQRALALLAAAALGGRASPAIADDPAIDVRFEYPDPAPADCPPAAVFQQQVTSRSARLRATRTSDTAPRLVVRLTKRPGRLGTEVTGELSIRYAVGSDATRTVDGDTCESVVSALALMSALALDPAVGTPSARADPATPPPALAPAPPPTFDGGDIIDLQAGTHVAAGLRGGAMVGMAPDVVLGVAAFVEVSRIDDGRRLWAPALRASLDYSTSGDVPVTGGGVAMARTTLMLDGCPVRLARGPLRLAPCLHVEAGLLEASGADVNPVRTSDRPWLAIGALASAKLVFRQRLFLEVSGGPSLPLVRDRFYFDPNRALPVYQVPVVAGLLGVAVGFAIF